MQAPIKINTISELDDILTTPSAAVIEAIRNLDGDLMILGAGGKMGVTLALLAKQAIGKADVRKRVICVSGFSRRGVQKQLDGAGIETIAADLLDDAVLQKLPEVENIIYMVGMKFGSTENAAATWAVNTFLPGMIAKKFRHSRIVLFSTGNVYPLVAIDSGGCKESGPVGPVGEYAQSALGRERVFEYFSQKHRIPGLIFRLNYAIDLRYGVLLDVAQKVYHRQPIDLSTGYVNVIWQGDANAIALRALHHVESPPLVLNVTGAETVSVRKLAACFGEKFEVEPVFSGIEQATAFLSNASLCHKLFGEPQVSLEQMIDWTAHWVKIGGRTLSKPTKFEVRTGAY